MTNEQTYVIKSAQAAGKHTIEQARDVLQRAADELQRYLDQYEHGFDRDEATEFGVTNLDAAHCKQQARVVGYAIGYTSSNIIGNLRIDLLADAQARLLLAADSAK
jgi:mannose/cellobiose epimerase-like protein (N-acyl-D-glucosamine 2-epimerase family)